MLPWIHLATHPHGDVSLCCRVDFRERRGMAFDNQENGERYFYNLNHDRLDKILNSDSFKDARIKMLKNEKPLPCMGCFEKENLGIISKRMIENKFFNIGIEDLKSKTGGSGEIKPNIEYAELRLGNLCNVKCRTCNPYSSSKWSLEYGAMQKELDFLTKYDLSADFTWAENEDFWSDFLENTGQLKQLYINGGEPTLIKQHWLFLERLVKMNLSQNIDIKYNINMTYLPDNAFEIWKNFKSIYVGASIDDLYERNSYIRHGADWNKVINNINLIRDAGFHIALEQTVSVYNVFYLDEMVSFCRKNHLGYGLNFVCDPEFLSINCIPDKIRNIILAKLHNKISDKFYKEISAYFTAPENMILWNRFRAYNQFLDRSRDENFKDVFSEFADILSSQGYL